MMPAMAMQGNRMMAIRSWMMSYLVGTYSLGSALSS